MSNQTPKSHLPSEFALLPLRRGVLFPGTTLSLPVGRRRSLALVEDLRVGDIVGVGVQRDPKTEAPLLADLHDTGTYARVEQILRGRGKRNYRVVLEGISRFRLEKLEQSEPYWKARGAPLPDRNGDSAEAKVLAQELRDHVQELTGDKNEALTKSVESARSPGELADRIIGALDLEREKELQGILTTDVPKRLRFAAALVAEAKALYQLKHKIGSEVRRELSEEQRRALLRGQLRAIQRELGERGEGNDVDKLREKLDAVGLPEEAAKVVEREIERLSAMSPNQPDFGVTRNYLEWIADLPWEQRAQVRDDLDAVARKLDEDHYGLDKIKERILEHLAVAQLGGNKKGTILCLAGPPGVGKTSLGQSIADATERPFIRVALGGVRDESEIRGHRRTYVGALPGRLINALRKVKVKNPVIMLDEIDKLGQGWMGSPEAALLEVLDPEQNHTFTDHYLELPFDLSEVMFIATANSLERLSAPLRDRLEIIELSGYTAHEKKAIARSHLIPRKLEDHALDASALTITDEALDAVVREYTREAGVRQLGRQITKLCRALALEVVRSSSGQTPRLVVDARALSKYLGKPRFFAEVAERTSVPGVATGLAWTPAGGDILFIETSKMKGKGALQITGQLGDVMKESARAALTYVRSNSDVLGVDADSLEAQDIHIHVPAGGVPKDGPSAGVTIFTALTSLLTGRRVRSDTAMTGECTLRGRVLPVGGIKEKVLAAHRAGIKRVIVPSRNERDLDDVPESARKALEFIVAEDMAEVLDAALEPLPSDSITRNLPTATAV